MEYEMIQGAVIDELLSSDNSYPPMPVRKSVR